MVRDGLRLTLLKNIKMILAEHMFCFLINDFTLRNLHYFPKVLKILNNNYSEVLILLTLYSTPILKLTLLVF